MRLLVSLVWVSERLWQTHYGNFGDFNLFLQLSVLNQNKLIGHSLSWVFWNHCPFTTTTHQSNPSKARSVGIWGFSLFFQVFFLFSKEKIVVQVFPFPYLDPVLGGNLLRGYYVEHKSFPSFFLAKKPFARSHKKWRRNTIEQSTVCQVLQNW